ncbi:MAG: glycerol kinase GlpK [Pseudomonadota bacterium]
MSFVLAIDQGTTSTRAILFGEDLSVVRSGQQEFAQYFPAPGLVEHDPADLLQTTLDTCRIAIGDISPGDIAAIGITNQRETVIVWDRATGVPVHNAIVWQDRRTGQTCDALRAAGHEPMVTARTGLLLDPYFSATKLGWLMANVDGVRERAAAGELLAGTVDTWLIWHLTDGAVHATDATNAARTMLYDIHSGRWDADLCALFGVPMSLLPEVRDSADDFGVTELFGGRIPVRGVAGDQQAATVGQACFAPGMLKSTYGTGCFALLNTGSAPVASTNRLLTTIAYQIDGAPTYALEGSIFVAGAVVQWLRDGLEIIGSAPEAGMLAAKSDPEQAVYIVPAFVGLGAPYWDSACRGAVYGLSRGTGPAELARSALESVGYQTRDLLEAMKGDWSTSVETVLRVDGGMTASDWTMQFLADILGAPVDRPKILETTALGAAWLAGMKAGIYPGADEFAKGWALDRRFEPDMDVQRRDALYAGWKDAVRRTLSNPA